jgi:hypothetical protein
MFSYLPKFTSSFQVATFNAHLLGDKVGIVSVALVKGNLSITFGKGQYMNKCILLGKRPYLL